MTEVRITDQEVGDCFECLWRDAFAEDPFGALCTLLRVSGMQGADWDPLEESEEAFQDYNWYLKAESDDLSDKSRWRIGLLMYCQAVEMSAVHTMLANILRLLLDQPYHMNPLGQLGRPDKKRRFRWFPPSATTKWRKIKNMAVEAERADLVQLIAAVYNDGIRNAFSHSDYIITDTYLRWIDGGPPQQMPLEQVSNLVANSFSFFGIFMGMRDRWLELVAAMPRYHKWPNYEVLELLQDNHGRLYGFQIHFSNGNYARFARTSEGVDILNMMIRGDGTLERMVGSLDDLRPVWMVDGRAVDFGVRDRADEL